MLFKKSKNLVGLDIGSSAVKLVELKDAKGGGYRLVKTGIEPLSPEAIVDGAIMDASLVVDTVNRVISSLSVVDRSASKVRARQSCRFFIGAFRWQNHP